MNKRGKKWAVVWADIWFNLRWQLHMDSNSLSNIQLRIMNSEIIAIHVHDEISETVA